MDNAACDGLGQTRTNWDRGLHTDLLKKLTQAGSRLIVFDIHFKTEHDPETDEALAEAIRRHGRVVLMASVVDPKTPVADAFQATPPCKRFFDATTNIGIGQAEIGIARRHWPFPASEERDFPSLPWVAARLEGWRPNEKPTEQWLRYYGEKGPWENFSYHLALSNATPANFRDKIVFIGSSPQQSDPGVYEQDKFSTPYTRRTGRAVGGMEIMATTFLNLINNDWLRRLPLKSKKLIRRCAQVVRVRRSRL
jgi:CHASE2 domain-containing sensor protein